MSDFGDEYDTDESIFVKKPICGLCGGHFYQGVEHLCTMLKPKLKITYINCPICKAQWALEGPHGKSNKCPMCQAVMQDLGPFEAKQQEDKGSGGTVIEGANEDATVLAAVSLAKKGNPDYEIVVAKEDQLQIDYDFPDIPKHFYVVLDMMERAGIAGGHAWEKSSSGNVHCVVQLKAPMSEVERVAWQAAFGSDPMREALTLMRIRRGVKNPILLFMRKDHQMEVVPEKPSGFRKFQDHED